MSFTALGLSDPILQAVAQKGYDIPSPIQAQAIPAILDGKDVMAAAQTGTGKTAGFTLPILERLSHGEHVQNNQVRALILTPTRELAAQVGQSVADYGKNLRLRSAVVFGGVNINPQMMKLRKGVDVLVATPGRLLDLHSQNAVRFNQVEVLVLDEADRMLDMGFIHDIRKIIGLLPKKRQNLMFSATFSTEIRNLAKGMVNNPVEISVSPRNTTVTTVKQWICPVDKSKKSALLTKLIQQHQWYQVLVFARTKHGANRLTKHLDNNNIRATAIHGNKSQSARTKALADFKKGSIQVLVATDIAARGLDIDQLPQVINFDLPNVPEDYVHRIGRTGRAGATGNALSLVSADEFKQLVDIERVIQQVLPREPVDGYLPEHDVPESRLGQRSPPSSSKPKKVKFGARDARGPKTNSRNSSSSRDANTSKARPANKKKKTLGKSQAQAGRPSNQRFKKTAQKKSANAGNSAGRAAKRR